MFPSNAAKWSPYNCEHTGLIGWSLKPKAVPQPQLASCSHIPSTAGTRHSCPPSRHGWNRHAFRAVHCGTRGRVPHHRGDLSTNSRFADLCGLFELRRIGLATQRPLGLARRVFLRAHRHLFGSGKSEACRGVVLCCTFVRNPRPGLRWLSGLARIPAPLPPSRFLSAMPGRFATPRLRLMLQNALAKVPPVVLRARLRAVVSVDVREQARTLGLPVLYLKATSDRLVPQLAVVEVAKYCRNMTVQLLLIRTARCRQFL